ncbi:MAG TPA: phenylalanine--tRNA ligase subunit alpha [Flavobacteriales bacterium]|nr:phenylalanine--tRNA ligase subunit alpha [Flavobacteriales bacterium]HMW96915.1 phenylalanine--tRNA ligase subunit alpha [Flavobacteriales bacterium]HMZ49683.1 phenylalanine--tRNA ligase subunit alpha [Flavobacteriales bacterium]HNK41553.1 phenylalanine--tRNA ligase subunit alpha [Flavobacteriales bacterium]HNK67635.1 phenylalanine--tRNA ligase subunit alpha [Flavobacteriales bacterium]
MNLQTRIEALEAEVGAATAGNADEVERFRVATLGRNGSITALFEDFKQVPPDEKRAFGQRMNRLKELAQNRWKDLLAAVEKNTSTQEPTTADPTRPALAEPVGSLHPITLVRQRITDVFARMGYTVSQGPEVEDDHHNFSALNFPPDHPARDMQDTFFVEGADGSALRTHTSSVQVRVMESSTPPIRTISPGRVYRNEAISARAHCMFHQVEGLYVDKGVSFAELKGTLAHFVKSLFGPEVTIRMRPSYFPFTEPSAEVDMSCTVCGGKGCNLCKHSGWVEIMGCGMVDPAVLTNCGIDPGEYSGFAFGMGVERIAQLIYRVPDLRLYWENDVRFLEQFSDGAFRA